VEVGLADPMARNAEPHELGNHLCHPSRQLRRHWYAAVMNLGN